MNRIEELFSKKKQKILSIYFTAGHPELSDTVRIIEELDKAGVDMIEIGMPFSDPVADGPVIQRSSETALLNGMSLRMLFKQLEHIREVTDIPLILMGYINPFYRYGFENLLEKCRETGIDGTIIPDLPVEEYLESYESAYLKQDIHNIFLVSPQTPDERIRYIDSLSKGFIYFVSSSSTTGSNAGTKESKTFYFERIRGMQLESPGLIGFGISDRSSFREACSYSAGAIIGSGFIKALEQNGSLEENIRNFIGSLR